MGSVDDYQRFARTLPYASELFGVYRPLIGWSSRRKRLRLVRHLPQVVEGLAARYRGVLDLEFNADGLPVLGRIGPGVPAGPRPVPRNDSVLLGLVAEELVRAWGPGAPVPDTRERWEEVVNEASVVELLTRRVYPDWETSARQRVLDARRSNAEPLEGEDREHFGLRYRRAVEEAQRSSRHELETESAAGGMLLDLVRLGATNTLTQLFYGTGALLPANPPQHVIDAAEAQLDDPFVLFDPSTGLPGVSVSPIGIVHLFRQFFFEFDTFLGTPTGHVWLSPGSSVELVEINTRKTITERSVATEYESTVRNEREVREQDEVSQAVKQENRNDTKLGFSTTVNQSWGTGDATATASIGLDSTQQLAREDTHKRLREQSEKVTTEIRSNYKTTFKTVTEVTDVSSKRYVLSNDTPDLVNYEMRRKMRQVGVQVQDVGTYLCWETFVDEPGKELGLANLVHVAKPADLAPQPNQQEIPDPPNIPKTFDVTATWDFDDRRRNTADGYIPLGTVTLPIEVEAGYRIEQQPGSRIGLGIRSASGEGAGDAKWWFTGKRVGDKQLEIGVVAAPSGLEWDERIDFVLVGEVTLVPTDAKKAEIATANGKIVADGTAATRAAQRAALEAFHNAAKERIEQAAAVAPRKFEDLREEERTVVYRALIRDLMTEDYYAMPETEDNLELRHVYATVLDAIFDVDKMLYFVAPEWWKPRRHYSQFIGRNPVVRQLGKMGKVAPTHGVLGNDLVVNWSDGEVRQDNYYITAKSEPARLGSSLGWLLQLDGDDHRNRFLNAPWVRAVMPIRPGKERAALAWLQKASVEGVDGLDAVYAGSAAERDEIRTGLLAVDAADPVADPPTVGDAVRYLCVRVAGKHQESLDVALFPDGGAVDDASKVSATPVDKVYEHGFYPLAGGFRHDPKDPAVDGASGNFQVFDQWIEILPTDQIVPVEVTYDPKTGRQI